MGAFHFVLGAATFDQLWYVQERGFDRAEIAQLTGWIGIIAGISGNLFGGIGGDWLLKNRAWGGQWLRSLSWSFWHPSISTTDWSNRGHGFGRGYSQAFSTRMFLRPNVFDHSGAGSEQIEQLWLPFTFCCANLVETIGVTVAGIYIDHLAAAGSEPYTMALLWFTVISMAAIPLFFGAGADLSEIKPSSPRCLAKVAIQTFHINEKLLSLD